MTKNLPKISQNSNENFIFQINKKMVSLELLINWKNNIDLEHLFLIFKSIIMNPEVLLKFVYISGKNMDDDVQIFKNIRVYKLVKMTWIDFIDWFEDLYYQHENYLLSYEYYCIGFVFPRESSNWIKEEIYPIFPWPEGLKETFIPRYRPLSRIKELESEISMANKKIKELQDIIDTLKKK